MQSFENLGLDEIRFIKKRLMISHFEYVLVFGDEQL